MKYAACGEIETPILLSVIDMVPPDGGIDVYKLLWGL